MRRGLGGLLLLALLIVVGVSVLQPIIERRLFSATTPRAVEPRGDLAGYERTTIELFERVAPSVVQVVVRGAPSPEQMEAPDAPGPGGAGSGFVWDAAGHIVTNNHVVQGGTAIAVRFASANVARAQLVGTAPNYDLAVIRVSGVQLPPPIPVGSSADLKVGQAAFAIGNPFGLDQTLTTGIISALKRRLPTTGGREIANVIQTDTAINPGNSGGPLLDSAGRLIGVNTAIFSPSGASAGIGFAIPVDVVNRIVPELIRDGRVPTPGIGIIAGNEALAPRLGVEGVVVVRTAPSSPAERAGLRGVNAVTGEVGDVIVGVNGKPVRRLPDLTDELEQLGVGKSAELMILRGGSRRTVTVDIIDVAAR